MVLTLLIVALELDFAVLEADDRVSQVQEIDCMRDQDSRLLGQLTHDHELEYAFLDVGVEG